MDQFLPVAFSFALAEPIVILAVVVGFYMAWNIGANDVANAMGTSVGSNCLTFRQAVIVAAIFRVFRGGPGRQQRHRYGSQGDRSP